MNYMMDDERYRREFEEVKENCPWRWKYKDKCRPTLSRLRVNGLRDCTMKECALFHFYKKLGGRSNKIFAVGGGRP